MTVAGIKVAMGMELFLEQLHGDLKSGRYKPSPSRRKLIPKPRQPGKFRPLGIPTVNADCTGPQFGFGMGGDPPSVSSVSRAAL